MNILFKKENLKTTILTILYLFLGVLFCILQVQMYHFVESVLCILLLGAGVVSISIYALMSREDKILKMLLYGVIGVTLGIFMLIWPRFFGIILSVIAGLGGLMMFIDALKDRKKGVRMWVTDFVIGLLVTLMSVTTIVLSGTNVAKVILSIFFGIIFLTQGIYSLVQLISLCKKEKNSDKTAIKQEKNKIEQVEIVENSETKTED